MRRHRALGIALLAAGVIGMIGVVAVGPACRVAAAQDEAQPCSPVCPNDPWGPEEIEGVTMQDGCTVTVSFNVRFTCGTHTEVSINSIQASPGNPSPLCDYLKTAPIAPILDAVTVQLFKDNPDGDIPPTKPGCMSIWRVVKGSCWSRLSLPGTIPVTELTPCTETACCQRPFKVCLKTTGARTATRESYAGGYPETCPVYPPQYGSACEPVCQDQ